MCWEYSLKGHVSPPLITSHLLGGCMGLRWLHLICRLGSSFVFKWLWKHNFSVCFIVWIEWIQLCETCVNSVISAQYIWHGCIWEQICRNKIFHFVEFPLSHCFRAIRGPFLFLLTWALLSMPKIKSRHSWENFLLFCFVKSFVQVNAILKMTWEKLSCKRGKMVKKRRINGFDIS